MLNRSQGGREGRNSFDGWGSVSVGNLVVGKAGVPVAVCEMNRGQRRGQGSPQCSKALG